MHAAEALKKRFEERLSRAAIATAIEINDAGLVFGAGTVLARMTGDAGDASRLDLNADWRRIAALLTVAYGRPVSPDVFRHIEGASEQWRRGDKALANIRLAFARLPRLEDRASIARLFHAEDLLERGVSPFALMLAFGFKPEAADLAKYDPNQPRVPAGNGRQSGEWRDGGGTSTPAGPTPARPGSVTIIPLPTDRDSKASDAFLGPVGARVGVGSFLAEITPETLEALTTFAARFSIPTAVLGALIIPSSNEGIIAQGTLPDHSDVSYRLDRPEGSLVLSANAADGSNISIRAQNRDGIFVDIATGTRIGRDLQGDLFLSWDAVQDAIEARKDPQAAIDPEAAQKSDEPQLCPAPVKDTPHGASDRALDYEDDVHARVNPLAPIPRGFAVMFTNPVTGEQVYIDDCFRYAGDLVDHDMKKGDAADAKGEGYEWLLSAGGKLTFYVMQKLEKQAEDQVDVTNALGLGLKWYFAEKGAADYVRKRFQDDGFGEIVIGYMPPRRRR